MAATRSDAQDKRNNLWPPIRTIEEARDETVMGVAALVLGGLGTLGVILGHHRSIWHLVAGAMTPAGMDPGRLLPILLAGQLAAFAILAVQLWRGPAQGPALLALAFLATEFVIRVATGAGEHILFVYMAATAYAVTAVRAGLFERRFAEGRDLTTS